MIHIDPVWANFKLKYGPTKKYLEVVCQCGRHHHVVIPDWYLDD
jgi:hypothetical protein